MDWIDWIFLSRSCDLEQFISCLIYLQLINVLPNIKSLYKRLYVSYNFAMFFVIVSYFCFLFVFLVYFIVVLYIYFLFMSIVLFRVLLKTGLLTDAVYPLNSLNH